MAATVSLSFPLDPQNLHHRFVPATTLSKARHLIFSTPPHKYPLPNFHKYPSPSFKISSSHSHSSATLDDPFRTGRFLSDEELQKLKSLESFVYYQELKSGSMWVRVMRDHEMDLTVRLLAESFAESMLLPKGYVNLLGFLVKQYLIERRTLMPHMATLIGFYRGVVNGDGEEQEEEEPQVQLAGTVEVCFDKMGANASLPSPTPPKDSPYICNMAVQKSLRRRGIGWHLLKASEELISQMNSSREVYLHCRIIDAAPLNMYTKADYKIVKTDSILVLLMLQRRKHLMCKKLPLLSMPSDTNLSGSDE
ncbi:GCN5-related N-acetyltransferase 5, chloroplastic [Gastrolobium bilobum]|uniref:GCN5-related N-acetyltransferase 5, chloroplastic n=1 Tax=Gastrolobium bilobum TaxID=150636 RepID=UPI002AB1611C|nr:GCN5-related N-acetyltransferase 5, chloroplastic [Gastrolobium bilobum]